MPEPDRDRAFGFGITAIVIGVIAVIVSLTVKNLNEFWCSPPPRWRKNNTDRP